MKNQKQIKKFERGESVGRLGFGGEKKWKAFVAFERENEEDEWIGVMCI